MTMTRALAAPFLILALLLASAPVQGETPNWRIDLTLDPEAREISGELSLLLPAGRHEFHLLDELEVRGARTGRTGVPVETVAAGRYRIDLPAASEVTVAWGGQLPTADPFRSRLFLSPGGGFLPEGGHWYPRFEQDAFALHLEARIPGGQRFVATGSLHGAPTTDDGWYRAVYKHPRADSIVVATGPWVERTLYADGVLVRTLFPENLDAAHAGSYLEHTREYLGMFSERAGPYPYDSFTIAASPMPVGFAFPGFTLLGERVIPLPFIPRTSLAHELMHNWWGTGVRVDYATGNWSEGLTTYMADYHLDELRGEGASIRHRWLLDLTWLPEEKDRPLGTFRSGNQGANRIVGYNRGALLFHMLRERIGDEAFDAGTRKIADRHMFEVAGWDDLIRAFSDAAGLDLEFFFAPWLQRPGLPELALRSISQKKSDSGWVLTGELEQVQEGSPWPLLVPVVVETDAGQKRQVVLLDTRQNRFELTLDAPAHAIAADPGFDVLRRLPDPPPILRTVTLNPNTRLIPTQEGLMPFARAMLEHPPEIGEEFDPRQPLLVMGSTEDVIRWLDAAGTPAPPKDLARRGHARMWTLPGTQTAVISSSDAEGLRNLVGALRHHGHRSYLIQDADGRGTEFGVWESETDPLRIELQ